MVGAAKMHLPPHPKDYPLVGSVPSFIRDTPQTFVNGWRDRGDVVRFRGLRSMVLVSHPDGVKHVLEDNFANYRRSDTVTKAVSTLLGESSFTARGDTWRQRAALVHPLWLPDRLPGLSERVAAAAAAATARWDKSPAGATVDLYEEMRTMSLERGGDFDRWRNAAVTAIEYMIAKTMALGGPPDVRVRPAYRRFLHAVADVETVVSLVIAERRRHPGDDLVSGLVQARSEDGQGLTDREVRDEVITFLTMIYVGVASGVMWVLWLLAQHPDVRSRVRSELDAVLEERPVTADSTTGLRYTKAVIDEALRLYPSLWIFARMAEKDDVIGGFDIPAGQVLVVCPYITHRHPAFWQDPERFDPGRFLDPSSSERHPYAYFPFSGGPRGCRAGELGLAMIRIAVALLSRHHEFDLVSGHQIARRREFALRPSNGIPARVSALVRDSAEQVAAKG
jgi:cytochrome P450